MYHFDMICKLNEVYIKEGNNIHPKTRNNKTGILNQTTFINSLEQLDDDDANSQTIRMKASGNKCFNNQ
jgi:hypothetical protein